MAKLCPLFSGSKGNSYYISSGSTAILIDAGKNAKQIENALKDNNLDLSLIKAIFVTHEHTDHISAIKVFASRHNIKVYSSEKTAKALEKKGILTEKISYEIIKPGNSVDICDLSIKPFSTDHDCLESLGFVIHTADDKKIGFATDLGYVSDEVFNSLNGCNTVVLESNHDIAMLECGPYPYELKRRILSDTGHLSNIACAKTLSKLVKNNTTRIMLAHLSKENNMEQIAYQTTLCELLENGLKEGSDFLLDVAPEYNSGGHTFIF
ncbi:MAG: MBL fold metallo-hydrolase [Clostridia bacterium]|nr:MBL fold metallo-hydrolase [Clostridia bacterium]